MKARYRDILERIPEKPKWYDENGVPRYCTFSPKDCSSIYAYEVILLEIACQYCKEIFEVELFWEKIDALKTQKPGKPSKLLKEWLDNGKIGFCPIHYGDPPQHNCDVGNSMNCLDLRIKEFWTMGAKSFTWVRVPDLEVELESLNV